MNIQARKLILIEKFLRITDESLITRLELLMQEENNLFLEKDFNFKPMSLAEFHDMIDRAKRDSDTGQVISHQKFKEKVKTWK